MRRLPSILMQRNGRDLDPSNTEVLNESGDRRGRGGSERTSLASMQAYCLHLVCSLELSNSIILLTAKQRCKFYAF